MDFRELQYIIAIAKYQNITRAAESLYISQPTMTKFLQQLEKNINQKLFTRVGKKLLPTYAGERYIDRAAEILAIKSDLDQELSDISDGASGSLKIGFSSIRGSEIILNVIPKFVKMHPGVQICFQETNADTFESLLISGDLDLAFYNLPITSEHIEYQVIAYEEVILVASAGSSLCQLAVPRPECRYPWLDLQYTKGETFIMLSKDLRMSSIVNELMIENRIRPKVSFYTKNVEAACILASVGHGLAFTGEQHIRYTKFDHTPAMFSIGNPVTRRTFVAASRKGAYLPPYAQDLIDLMRSSQQPDKF